MAAAARTARERVFDAEQRFVEAGLVFGHGTDNARDEAVFLVFHALQLSFDVSEAALNEALTDAQCERIESLVATRIATRKPAAYITGRMWFAGLEFTVNQHVLVPRSPIAELLSQQFTPWLNPGSISRVLEVGTGSACIAIAIAKMLPHVCVDATDISPAALAVAEENLQRYPDLGQRVRLIEADVFPHSDEPYDLIVSNPPYVPSAVVAALPPEYHHEPAIGLDAGDDGLDVVRRIIAGARERLSDDGSLLLDVGEMAADVDRAFSNLSFTWVELKHGGEGIGIAHRREFRS